MQLHDRFSSANRPPPNTTIIIARLALFGLFTVPLIVAGYFVTEFRTLAEGWPWRNAVVTKALITNYDTELVEVTEGDPREVSVAPGEYTLHLVTFTYQAGGREFSDQIAIPSTNKTKMVIESMEGTWEYTPVEGKSFNVYYLPHDPTQNKQFFDPRPPFWKSARRIGIGAGLGLSMVVMIGLIVVFYKPNRRGKSRLPKKLDLA